MIKNEICGSVNSARIYYSQWKSQQMQAKKKKCWKWKHKRIDAETKRVHCHMLKSCFEKRDFSYVFKTHFQTHAIFHNVCTAVCDKFCGKDLLVVISRKHDGILVQWKNNSLVSTSQSCVKRPTSALLPYSFLSMSWVLIQKLWNYMAFAFPGG